MSNLKTKLLGPMVWAICSFFFLYEFFLRTVIGTFQISVMRDLEISSLKFSFLSTTSYMLVYGLMQIPVSLLVNRLGLKKSMMIGATACGFSAIGLASSYNFPLAVASRMLMGFGSSFGFICLLVAIYDWMPKKYNAVCIGISQFAGTMGPLVAAGPLATITESISINWRFIFLLMGGLGFALAVLIFLVVDNNREQKGPYLILTRPESIFSSFKKLFTSTQPWVIAVYCATVYFSIEYFSENEGVAFLTTKGFTASIASSMISLIWLGFAIGCPLAGLISDLIQRRKIVLVVLSAISVIAVTTIVYSYDSNLLAPAFFFLGFAASAQSLGFAVIADHFKKSYIAIGYGLNNALITIIVAISAPFVSLILELTKKAQHPNSTEYIIAFQSIIALTSVSLILSIFFLQETYCKSKVDFTFLKIKSSAIN
jgi:MFS family permease